MQPLLIVMKMDSAYKIIKLLKRGHSYIVLSSQNKAKNENVINSYDHQHLII